MAQTSKGKQPRRKHSPQRSCVICREKRDKRSLTRLVRTAENRVMIDATGKLNGRGAYLCEKVTCWDDAIAQNMLNTALKLEMTDADKQAILAQRPTQIV